MCGWKKTKDIGMGIHKNIVACLPCLVAFWGFHPYFFVTFSCYLVGGGGGGGEMCDCATTGCSYLHNYRTPYIGMAPKKMAAPLHVYKMTCSKVCARF